MEEEFLSLTWNSHGATYQEMLYHLRIENILTDCTLACDGQKFSVHRLVLVTCSDFFKSLLGDVVCQHPIVYLRGVNGTEMQKLIDFMYLGKIDVPHKAVENLISTAEALQIKGLGVLHENTDKDSVKSTNKRKRQCVSRSRSKELSHHDVSSLSPKCGASETNCSNLECPSPDVKGDTSSKNVTVQEILHKNFEDEMYFLQGKEKIESLSNGSENILSPIFKSPPLSSASNIISYSENSSTVNSYSVSTSKDSSKETITLTELTTLQPPPQKHSKTINEYYEGNQSSAIRVNTGSYLGGGSHLAEALDNLPVVKEEALDYTRNSTVGVAENCTPSDCQDDSTSTRFSVDNSGQDHLSRNSNVPQVPYSQDENLNVGNGTDLSRPFICPICFKSFAKVAILKRHHLAHFRPYNCHLCPRSFTRREVLAEHVLEHNGADLRLPCPVCKMTIKRKRNLQAHIKVKHPEYHQLKSANNEALF